MFMYQRDIFSLNWGNLVFLSSWEILLNTKLLKLIERIIHISRCTSMGQNTTKIPKLVHHGAAGAQSPWNGPRGLELATCTSGNPRNTIILFSAPVNSGAVARTDRSKNESWLKKLLLEACSLGNCEKNLWNKICKEGHDKTALRIWLTLLIQTQTLWQRACTNGWPCLANKRSHGVHVMVMRYASQYSSESTSAQQIVMNNFPFTLPGLPIHKYSGHYATTDCYSVIVPSSINSTGKGWTILCLPRNPALSSHFISFGQRRSQEQQGL